MTDTEIRALLDSAERTLSPQFFALEETERTNFARVMDAFREEHVAVRHFAPTTGYGYGDDGRDALERIFARIFGCEDALVRPSIASGTHALALCLFGLLRPGDVLVAGSGKPYDTLESVIGLSGEPGQGSLREFGVDYAQVDLKDDDVDLDALLEAIKNPKAKVVALQRSRGYDWRASLSVERLGEIADAVHKARPDVVVMVDNCYGEFVCDKEPTHLGCDIAVGSLIKNPGGGIAPTGGYLVGRADLIEKCACRLTSPGIGREVGSYLGGYDRFYQGLFLAPHVVCQAVKGAMLAAAVFSSLGFAVSPGPQEARSDIIQAIRFADPEKLIAFCQGIQYASPIDSHVTPEPWDMPGYQDPVIMAAGTFVSGASIELSADAPIRAPYIGYMQGGLTFTHVRYALEHVLRHLSDKRLI
ncbi:MAG: aminotransferase class I/II-fold pyridoxal phosphate-dependent enzyme [Candidatus Spyradocola sp.]|jgi:cystathionine beta-lyase family protein involved in aluminum resistance